MVRSFEVPAAPGWRCRLLPRRLAASALALLGLAACDRQPEPARPAAGSNGDGPPAAEQARVLGLTPWHADFPFEVALSPRRPGHWYDRSKRQALAQIVANLQGNCTQQAWHFARVFFNTAPAGAAELLADAAERNYTAQGLAPFMENLADAMACTRDESLAPVLLRLLDHPNSAVATSAATALISCGTPDTLRDAEAKLAGATLRARCDWLRAVARKAPQEVEAVYGRYLSGRLFPGAMQAIMEESAKLPPEQGARIVERLADPHVVDPAVALIAAGILHRAGDRRGTARLREFMLGENPDLKAQAIKAAAQRDLALVLDDVLQLSLHEDAQVRQAVAEAIATLPGDPIDETLTALGADVVPAVRQIALRALATRGKRYHLDQLTERVRTASGSNLSAALQDISASGDAKALAAIYERYQKVPLDEKRSYMQALAYSRVPAVFPYLVEIFLGAEEVLGASGLTTVASAALLMANIDGALPAVVELFGRVPREDHRRRAQLLRTAANMVGFNEDVAQREMACGLFRRAWSDRAEAPQVRLFALYQHRRYLTLEDAMTLKAGLAEETEPMRWALSDWLFEFF